MEDFLNPKRMARSKKASSQRSKAKHSKHHSSAVAAVPAAAAVGGAQERRALVAEEEARLPSNWERYGEENDSGSEGGGDAATTTTTTDGEVRSKSKGADYSELLASDVPTLYEEPPEQGGMMAMLMANGLGLWEWDLSYLEPASTASKWQAERDASALLNVDMEALGKSMARLHVAERLLLEDTLFPKQDDVDDGVEGTKAPTTTADDDLGAGNSVTETAGSQHERYASSLGSRTESGNFSGTEGARTRTGTVGGGGAPPERDTRVPDKRSSGPRSADIPFLDSLTSPSSSDMERGLGFRVEPSFAATQQKQKTGTIISSGEADSGKAFEPNTAAETELDDLLNMLDNSAITTTSSKVGGKDDIYRRESSHSPPVSYSATPTRSQSTLYSPHSGMKSESRGTKVAAESTLGTSSAKVPSTTEKRVEESFPKTGATAPNVPPSLDEDFDAWLDSI